MGKISRYQRGQTLIEAIGALAILSIIISATAISVTTSLSNATFNKNQTLATKYAQQGSEVVRQIRNHDYSGFQNMNASFCLAKDQSVLTNEPVGGCTPNIDNFFVRSVQVNQNGCGANIAQVVISVSFADGKCQGNSYCHSQINTSCLSTINPVMAP